MATFYAKYPATNSSTTAIVANLQTALRAVFPTAITGVPKYQDAATTNITSSFTEVNGVGNGTVPASTKRFQISSTVGVGIQFGIGASSGAAVASIDLVAGGGPVYIDYTYVAGDKLFVKTLDSSTQSAGTFAINFTG